MKVLVIMGHPRQNSYCAALAEAYTRGALESGAQVELLILAEQPDAFEKKLAPRSAQIISTMDTPIWVDRLINGAPAVNALTQATLKFCGVSPVRRLLLSPIKHSSVEQKEEWLQEARTLGRNLQYGVLNPLEKFRNRIKPWIQAIRLQFYPMTFFAYGIGALAFVGRAGMDWIVFLLGYLLIFLLEVVVVFSNDYYDRETDQLNRYFSPFTGGSRVLVDGVISESALRMASKKVLLFCILLTMLIAFISANSFPTVAILVTALFLLAVSYTAPPLKISYRGWGEITVGFTHSFAVILCGFVFQGGALGSTIPWLLGIPLFFAIIPAIILAGFPDEQADRQIGKGTLAVRLGKEKASVLAIGFIVLSLISLFYFKFSASVQTIYPFANLYPDLTYLTLLHGLIFSWALLRYRKKPKKSVRIDGLLILGLTFILWFALVPFIRLLGN